VTHSAAPGLFLVLEGGDGAGKSTQMGMLADWLEQRDLDVVRTHEPGGSPIGAEVRRILLSPAGHPPSSRTEALLYAAERAEHVASVVRPALRRGAVVVCDRYIDSSVAYQGVGRGLGAHTIEQISMWATDELVPHLTVLLDVDPQGALARSDDPADRLESEPLDFHTRVRHAFLDLAARAPHRYTVVDASRSPAEVHRDVVAAVEPLLGTQAAP
jgi:dTMP kinase